MKVYKVITTKGAHEDFVVITIGIFSTPELAQKAIEKFQAEVDWAMHETPCPISEEAAARIESPEFPGAQPGEGQYWEWKYLKMDHILELNMDPVIVEVELDNIDLDFLKKEDF